MDDFKSAVAAGIVSATLITWQLLAGFGDEPSVVEWIVAVIVGGAGGLAVGRVGYVLMRRWFQ